MPLLLVYNSTAFLRNNYVGAFRNDELVSVMSFKKSRENVYELSSFVQKHCYDARNTAKYLFEKFVFDNSPKQVFGIKDLTNDANNVFVILGFH